MSLQILKENSIDNWMIKLRILLVSKIVKSSTYQDCIAKDKIVLKRDLEVT